MDSILLRTRTDCILFNQICTIYKLNDLCRLLGKSACLPHVRGLVKRINVSKPPHPTFMLFQKYCAYLTLTKTLNEFENDLPHERVALNELLSINGIELNSLWLRLDDMTPQDGMFLILRLLNEHSNLVARKYFRPGETNDIPKNSCWICMNNVAFFGVGRPDDPCNNDEATSRSKSTNFMESCCSHLVNEIDD